MATKIVISGDTGEQERRELTAAEETVRIAELQEEADKLATKEEVDAEAGRRINAEYAEWQQRNFLAAAISLQDKGKVNHSPSEQALFLMLEGVWQWIESVRMASDVIVLDPPHPKDLTDDYRWPENIS